MMNIVQNSVLLGGRHVLSRRPCQGLTDYSHQITLFHVIPPEGEPSGDHTEAGCHMWWFSFGDVKVPFLRLK